MAVGAERRRYQREWQRRKGGHAPQKRVGEADALGVLALLSIGMRQALIARVYGLSQQTVSKIKLGTARKRTVRTA